MGEMTRSPIQILDCTLRDGGYYNEWNFSRQLVDRYLQALHAARAEQAKAVWS